MDYSLTKQSATIPQRERDVSSIQHLEINQIPEMGSKPIVAPFISRSKLIKVYIFFGVYFGIMALLLSFFFYFLFGNPLDQQRVYSVLNMVSRLMKEPPIADLYVTSKDCPLGYEYMPFGEWPGTEHGCYYKKDGLVTPGNCNQENKGIGVQSIANQTISTWDGYKFCVRRYHSMAIEYSGDCPYGFQKCGTYLCVPEQEKCPITLIHWTKDLPADDSNDVEDSIKEPEDFKDEVKLIDHDKNNMITVERSETREPLVGFSVSYNGMPCLDSNSIPFPEKSYPLLQMKHKCYYGQNFEAMVINSVEEDDFLSELPLYKNIKELPLIDNYTSNGTVYLTGLNRFKVRLDEACSNPERFFIMGRVTDKANEITKIRNLFTVTVLFSVIIIIILGCDQRRSMSMGIGSVDLTMTRKHGSFIFQLCILLFLLALCCLIIVSPKVTSIKSYRDSLAVYSKNNCFRNTFITTALTDFANGPPYEAQLFYYLILAIGCLSLIPIAIVVIEKCKTEEEEMKILLEEKSEEED